MKKFGNPLLSCSAFFLILLAVIGFFHRQGLEKIQTLPAVFVGCGLITTSLYRRKQRRKMLLNEIQKKNNST